MSSGTNILTAAYSGDSTYGTANGTTTITVAQVILTPPSLASIAPGGTATGTVTLAASSTYSGTMSLSCSLIASPSGAQSLPTCTLSPASVALKAGANTTATFTVNTTGASTAYLKPSNRLNPWGLGGCGSALAFVFLFGVPRRRRTLPWLILFLIAFSAGIVACGGSNNQHTGASTPGTTAGNYTFSVTGTDTASPSITASANVTIAVQ